MTTVRMTVKQLDNLGLWEKVREYKGWNPYIRNEGQIADDEVVEFDDEFKKEKPTIEYDEINEKTAKFLELDYFIDSEDKIVIKIGNGGAKHWSPTTDCNDAIKLTQLLDKEYKFHISRSENGYNCCFENREDGFEWQEEANTFNEAICYAALSIRE